MIAVDTSNHWRFVTGRETVQYVSKTTQTVTWPGVTVPNAKRWPRTDNRELADALLKVTRVKWSFWRNQMPGGIVPKPGDAFKDGDGFAYVIQSVGFESPGQNADGTAIPPQRFDCECIQSQRV